MKTSGRKAARIAARHLPLRPDPDRVFSATSRTPRPTAVHSTAIDLTTNASGEVHAGVAGGPRDVAVALADGYMIGAHHRGRAPREHVVRARPARVLNERRPGPIRH
jgi:hypothetical protein